MGLKKLIFSALPTTIQHRIILKKTGYRKLEDVPFTSSHRADFFLTPKSQTWENRLSTPYGHEPGVVQWFERNLQKEDVVYDIGANMGYYGVLLNAIHPGIEFHGFEGNWFTNYYQDLNRRNLGVADSWHIIEKLVGDSDQRGFIQVNTYLKSNRRPSIFLMDVDGEEVTVLKGAGNLIDGGDCTFLIEVHPRDLAKRGLTSKQVVDFFNPVTYRLRYLPALREEQSTWKDTITETEQSEEFFLLATPLNHQRI